jgi:membrane-bound lytic murein transglycosylase
MRRDKTKISRMRNAKGKIKTNTMEVQEIIRDYFENQYSKNLKILKKWTDF